MAKDNVYTRNGYKNRGEYLDSLAEEYGDAIYMMAEVLGPTEDFDGLITAIEDIDFEGVWEKLS